MQCIGKRGKPSDERIFVLGLRGSDDPVYDFACSRFFEKYSVVERYFFDSWHWRRIEYGDDHIDRFSCGD